MLPNLDLSDEPKWLEIADFGKKNKRFSLLSNLGKGSFFNYVDQILPIIDHPPTPVGIGNGIPLLIGAML